MDAAIAQRLVALNQQFYQSLALPFSASRSRLQPGVMRVLRDVQASASVLDLGCGNGGVARELTRLGVNARYVGLDFSLELLEVAKGKAEISAATFMQADLTSSDWDQQIPAENRQFDFIFAFAALHHIPSRAMRLQFLAQVRGLLAPGGRFVHSNWQFLNSPRLRTRIQPWEAVGLSSTDLDEGDFLLDWRSGGTGLRYVHHFSEREMTELAQKAGFEQVDSFFSDGKTGNLALYQSWIASL